MINPTLTVTELDAVKLVLVKLVQSESFPEDLKLLRKGLAVSHRSRLRLLSPFLDANGVIRVGGRLQLSEEPYDVKHPIVLPGFHKFTKLLLEAYHRKLLHGRISMSLSVV